MERYFCKCLNIIINVNRQETRESKGKDLIQVGLDEVENIDPFFDGMLLDVRLAISGIEVGQPALSHQRSYGDWLVFTCLNCGLDTHAIHATKGADRVFLSVVIQHGSDILKDIRESSNYSNFLQLTFVETADRLKNDVVGFTPSSMLVATERLHDSCKKLIQAESDAKNERVRVFTEKENHRFRDYKRKSIKDKERLIRTIRNFDDSDGSMETLSESYFRQESLDSMEGRDVTTEMRAFKVPIITIPVKKKTENDSPRAGFSKSVPSETLSERINNQHKSGRSVLEKKNVSHSDDILFDMEGYNNEKDCEPFFESDDESSGDATSLESSGGFSGTSNRSGGISVSTGNQDNLKPGERIYASSLPVPVPLFNNTRHSYDPESDDELKSSPSLSKLAVSFKAVVKSMQDSTGMLGDLPPRRKEYNSELLSVQEKGYRHKK